MQLIYGATLVIAFGNAAFADSICPPMAHAMTMAEQMRTADDPDWAQAWALYLTFEGVETEFTDCGAENGMAVCRWSFDLADPASSAQLSALDEGLTRCLGPSAERVMDTGVNHPDIYDAILFEHSAVAISIARKRKSALGETRVTFRVTDRRN